MPSCKDEQPGQDTQDDDDESGTTFLPGTGEPTPTTTSEQETFEDSGDDGQNGQCDYFIQDCAEGDKCSPWSELADLVPDASRCCPILEPVAQTGDSCVVDGHLGSCVDNCAAGNICLDIDGDGEGVCQNLCGGTAEEPECPEADDECFVYFGGVPLCFRTCDPLVQDCPSDKGCYPDAIAEGGTGWLCMPTIYDNQLGDYCWLLSGCNPGLVCATPTLLPNCYGEADDAGCCTDICDHTEDPDPCKDIHPDLECTPWYFDGDVPPMVGLEKVGACVLPTVGGGA